MKFREAVLTAAVSLLLGLAGPAAANPCPTPTLNQCVDPVYQAGSCYPGYKTQCTSMVTSAWNTQVGALPTRVEQLPDSMGGGLAQVGQTTPLVATKANYLGFDTLTAGLTAKNQALYRKGFANLTPDEQAHYGDLKNWAANGKAISSCQEYVQEKYRDYNDFESNNYGGDFREIFKNASASILGKTLYGTGAAPLTPIFDGQTKVEKNAYFLFSPGPYPAGAQGYSFTSSASKAADYAPARTYYPESDSWHAQMNNDLANVNDDILDGLQVQQDHFKALLAERTRVWDLYSQTMKQLTGAALATLEKDTTQRLTKLDAQLDSALIAAEKAGCLDHSKLSSCDWSPRRYRESIDRVMTGRRDQDLSQCLHLTGNDFGPNSFVRNAQQLKLPGLPLNDYSVDPDALGTYLATYGSHLHALPLPIDPPTGLTHRSDSYSDGGEVGDRSIFATSLYYSGGWYADWGSTFCDANAGLDGSAVLSIWVFGGGGEVFNLQGSVGTEAPSNIGVHIYGRVFGIDTHLDWVHPAMVDFQVADPTFFDGTIAQASATFVIVFVPVTVKGGLAGSIGIEFRLGGDVQRFCATDQIGADIIGTITPHASLDAFAAIGIGVPGFFVGVKGTVTICRVGLPFTASVGLYYASPSHPLYPNTMLLHLTTGLGIQLHFLDGKIALYAELGPLSASFTIFSWTGIGGDVSLFDASWEAPLASL